MLKVEDLTVFYENSIAVNNISLYVDKGEIVGVFGSNGAGKSTLMYALSGVILDIKVKEERRGGERITVVGRIEFEGRDITTMKPHERARLGIILCPERRRVFPESTVMENLRIGGYLLRSRDEVRRQLELVLDIFPELKRLRDRVAGFLSGGEQQMLAI
jgi:branched-chain amino acid transport system ATP-binding protein